MSRSTYCGHWVFGILRLASLLLLGGWMIGCGSETPQPPGGAAGNAVASPGSARPAETPTDSETNKVPDAIAVFELMPGGKDPFFPNSLRIPSASVGDPEAETKPRLPLSSYLKIAGLRPSSKRPMALINNTIFEPGEEGTVEVIIQSDSGTNETRVVKIQCLEIRNDSVLIRVEGEPGVKLLSPPPRP